MNPAFFRSAEELRAWFTENHDREQVLWIGFYKKGSGQAGITYSEALDEALCFYVLSAKKEETRLRRLEALIGMSEKGERLGLVTGKAKGEKR